MVNPARFSFLSFLVLVLGIQVHAGPGPQSGALRTSGYELSAGMAGSCCCGTPMELSFPNLDFEDAPIAPPGGWIDYTSGQSYGPWVVSSGSISIHAPDHLNLGAGNPNGASQHLDLHGFSQGAARYPLSGLTAGNMYTIEFWYAIHSFASNPSASLRVGGGAWLNVSWNASNPGNVIWLKASYMFTAQASSTTMEFSGSGSTPCCGMLIDDIKIFECPSDLEAPEILNAPQDLQFECISQLPPPDMLLVQDNCDQNPSISFEERRTQFNICSLEINRKWTVTDQCKNSAEVLQKILISDEVPPVFQKLPANKWTDCRSNAKEEFANWLRSNGGAIATDNCSKVKFSVTHDTLGSKGCDSTLAEFIIEDDCGNFEYAFAYFIVVDSVRPKLLELPGDLILPCQTTDADSLIAAWILAGGGGKAVDECSGVRITHRYQPPLADRQRVEFFYTDSCGNSISAAADIIKRLGIDTVRLMNFVCGLTKEYADTTLVDRPGGCDSLAIVIHLPASGSLSMDTLFVCDSSSAGLDTTRYKNQYGCDSVIVQSRLYSAPQFEISNSFECDLDLPRTDTVRIPAMPCDRFRVVYRIPAGSPVQVRNETTCDSSQVGTDTLVFRNQHGCDSLLIRLVNFADRSYVYRDSMVCDLPSEFSDTLVFKTALCDSVVVTRFHRILSDTLLLSQFSCNPMDTGVVVRRLANQSGCDSLVVTRTELRPNYFIRDSQYVCRKSEEGIELKNYTTRFGCDSVVSIQKIYQEPAAFSMIRYTCNRDSVGSVRIVRDGWQCDSILIVDTRYTQPSVDSQSVRTCSRDSVGTDTILLKTSGGCDSIVYVKYFWKEILFSAESRDVSCFGLDDGSILFKTESGNGRVKYFINGIPVPAFTSSLAPGIYKLRMEDEFGCLSEEQTVRVSEREALQVDAGPDRQVKRNQSVDFSATSNRSFERISWSPLSFFDCPACVSTRAIFQSDTTIVVTVTDSNGCSALDQVRVVIAKEGDVYAPNVISVNGDQVNDRFYFTGPDDYRVRRLRIFDRWGALVFETGDTVLNDPGVGWDGSFRGSPLNPGVYAYVSEIASGDGELIIFHGDITLLR